MSRVKSCKGIGISRVIMVIGHVIVFLPALLLRMEGGGGCDIGHADVVDKHLRALVVVVVGGKSVDAFGTCRTQHRRTR